MKKIIKRIIIVLVVLVLVAAAVGYIFINRMLYPDALISGEGSTKVICVGDSITFGQGVMGEREEQTYTAMLASKLGTDYQVVNYGLCNRTLNSEGDMPYSNEDFATESLESEADIVIIMLGTNDSKPDFWNAELYEKEYVEFIEKYKAMGSNPKVYVMLPPVIFAEPENSGDCSEEVLVNEVIPTILRVAETTGVEVIDLHTVTEGHADWYADGLHPNKEGNEVIAEAIYQKLCK